MIKMLNTNLVKKYRDKILISFIGEGSSKETDIMKDWKKIESNLIKMIKIFEQKHDLKLIIADFEFQYI